MCTQLASIPLTIIQGIASMKSQQRSEQVNTNEAEYQAALKQNQAQEFRNEAIETANNALEQSEELKRDASRQQGKTRSLLSTSGLVMDSGSAADLLRDDENELNRNIADINRDSANAQSKYNYKAELSDYEAQRIKDRNKYSKTSDFDRGLGMANILVKSAQSVASAVGGSKSLL